MGGCTRLVTVKLPDIYLEGIDELVKLGRYSCRSEVIRTAIRDLLKNELWFSDEELSSPKGLGSGVSGTNLSNVKFVRIK